jgi:septum formation protein
MNTNLNENITTDTNAEPNTDANASAGITYVLASGSPRRIEMMHSHGYDPVICPADIDENIPLYHGMKETVMFLALKKAQSVLEMCKNGSVPLQANLDSAKSSETSESPESPNCDESKSIVIIGSDTIVYKDEIMGKPEDKDDAFRMLSALRNDVHYVVTGVALLAAKATDGIATAPKKSEAHAPSTYVTPEQKYKFTYGKVFAEVTRVYVGDFTDEELTAYVNTAEPYDKAGGYAIQGAFGKYIDHIEGDYDNVVGFPWTRIEEELAKLKTQISD